MRVAVIITMFGALFIFAAAVSVTACRLPNDRQVSEPGQTASQPAAKQPTASSESTVPEPAETAHLYQVLDLDYDDSWVANVPEFIGGYRVLTVYTPKSAACMDEPLITFHATQKSLGEYLAAAPDMNSLRAAVLAIPGVPSDIRLSFAGAPLDESGEPPSREEYASREKSRNENIARIGCADYRINTTSRPIILGPDTSVVPTGENGVGNLAKETSLDDKSPGDDANLVGEGNGEEPNGGDKDPSEETNRVGGEGPDEVPDSDGEKVSENAAVVMFPQHNAPLTTDRGGQNTVAKLVLDGGCLRAEYPSLEVDPSTSARKTISELLVWPDSFTLSTEDGVVRVVDANGRIAARVGDHVRITRVVGVRFQEALDQGLIHGLSDDCPGPYALAGDEVFAVSLDGPSVLQLSDPELHFPLQGTVFGEYENLTAEAIGELVLEGHCLRLRSADRPSRLIFWPSGFTPHVYRGVVHVRNGAGRIIAQVGDRLSMGGAAAYYGNYYADKTIGPKCPGPTWAPNGIKVLPKVEVYFPKQDGTLGSDGMERFKGKLVLTRRCLVVDRAVRVRDSVVVPGGQRLLIWPDTFTLNLDDEVAEIVDESGGVVARVGDEVQFSAVSISYQEAMDHTGLREITPACPGGPWVVGEDFTAVPDSESP